MKRLFITIIAFAVTIPMISAQTQRKYVMATDAVQNQTTDSEVAVDAVPNRAAYDELAIDAIQNKVTDSRLAIDAVRNRTAPQPAQTQPAPTTVSQTTTQTPVPQGFYGTWYDARYDCNWVMHVAPSRKGLCSLYDAKTNRLLFQFTTDNVTNLKTEIAATNDQILTFYCSETDRSYRFTRPVGSTNLLIDIYSNEARLRHRQTLTFRSSSVARN